MDIEEILENCSSQLWMSLQESLRSTVSVRSVLDAPTPHVLLATFISSNGCAGGEGWVWLLEAFASEAILYRLSGGVA